MSFQRGIDGSEPLRAQQISELPGAYEERHGARAWRLGSGTLACPRCDAPVFPAAPMAPSAALDCPYCLHAGPVRDFLSLDAPQRPARVGVHVRLPLERRR